MGKVKKETRRHKNEKTSIADSLQLGSNTADDAIQPTSVAAKVQCILGFQTTLLSE